MLFAILRARLIIRRLRIAVILRPSCKRSRTDVTSRAGTWRAVPAGSHYCDRESGTHTGGSHVIIALACSFNYHGSVPGNSYFCKASFPALGSTQWFARDALPRPVNGPPLIANVMAEWSYTSTNLVCSGVASFLVPGASSLQLPPLTEITNFKSSFIC